MGAADAGMAGEWDFLMGREDAHAITGFASRRCEQERGLHEVVPARKALHRSAAPVRSVEHHPKVIATPDAGRKHIQMQITYACHDDPGSLKPCDGSEDRRAGGRLPRSEERRVGKSA